MIPSSLNSATALNPCMVACSLVLLCVVALAQSNPTLDAKTIAAKINEARGASSKPFSSLSIEGTFGVTIDGVEDGKPFFEGKFREIFSGESLARQTSDMGDHGVMEKGTTEDLVWDLDPMMGAKIHVERPALIARRYFAILRGARPETLYQEIANTGTQMLDGREHVVVRMTPKVGKADTWYVDSKTWLVDRIDMALPAPEGADAVWAVGDDIDSQLTFGDWKAVDGVRHPHRRGLKMGNATLVFRCTKIEPDAKIDAARFTPPEAVSKVKGKTTANAPKADSQPAYTIVDRETQHVASIRLKVREKDIGATLAIVLPEVIAHINATGAKLTGAPFSRYHAVTGDEIDLEAGLPVAKPIEEKGRVKNSQLPGGRTVVAWHIGPYEKLKTAHEALRGWVDSNKLKAAGGPWEIYWTDPGVVPDSSKWRTQLFMPIEK